jgi:DNA-binding NtrC family response regulator
MPRIELAIIVCNEEEDRHTLIACVLKCGLSPICCFNLAELRALLPQEQFRLVLCEETLVDGDFRAVLREVRKTQTRTPVIVFGGAFDWDSYLNALGAGAFDYIVAPANPVETQRIIWTALSDTFNWERDAATPPGGNGTMRAAAEILNDMHQN